MSRRIALFAAVVMVALLVGTSRPADAQIFSTLAVNSASPQVVPGVANQIVKVLGTGFSNGAQVTIEPSDGIAIAASEFKSANEIDITLNVAGSAPTTARDVVVTQGLFGSSDKCELCLKVGPDITSVTGPLSNSGATGTFTITGRAFKTSGVTTSVAVTKAGYGFGAAETETLNASGGSVSVVNATTITATISTLGRAPGYWKVTVNQSGTTASFGDGGLTGLQITGGKPTITSIAPPRIEPNTSNKDFALVGKSFARGMTVAVSGTGVTQSAATVVTDATHATIRLTAASNAPVGVRTLTLRNTDSQISSSTKFGVGADVPDAPDPTITTVSPAIVGQGAAQLPLTIIGTNFVATPAVTIDDPPAGVTIDSVTWNSSTKLTVLISTAAGATTGPHSVKVANGPNGSHDFTKTSAFTVSSTFAVTGIAPPGRPQGYSGSFVVNGAGFPASPTVTINPATGLTVGTPVRDSAAKITVPITVAAGADLSSRTVSVNGTTCSECAFTVSKVPAVTSISPTSGNGGGQVAITDITGADFGSDPSVTLERTGLSPISMIEVERVSSTHLKGTFDLTDAAPGKWNLRVTNVDGGSAVKTDAFTVVLAAPSLTSAAPDFIAQNTLAPVTLHLVGTSFAPGMTVTVPDPRGITVTEVTRTGTTSADIKITASDNAALGSRDLKVTNADNQSDVCDSCFVVTQGNQQQFFGPGFNAYGDFTGGGFVAAGRLGGLANPADVVTAANAGGGPHVRAFAINPNTGTAAEVAGFMAYDPAFNGGVRVAVGDVDGDGTDEIITAPGPGGGPHVRVFHVNNDTSIATPFGGGFMAYAPNFAGGVWIGTGDVDGDGDDEIITGAGPGGGPHVRIFTLAADGHSFQDIGGFMAYGADYAGGVTVAAGNLILEDSDAPVIDEIVTTPSRGGGPHVRVWNKAGTVLREFMAFATGDEFGYRVAVGDFDFDTVADLAISRGSTAGIYIAHLTESAPFFEAIAAPNPEPLPAGGTVAAADFDADGDDDLVVTPDHSSLVTVRIMRPLSHS